MANTVLNLGSGGDTILMDDTGSGKFQRVKLATGASTVDGGTVTTTNPLPQVSIQGQNYTDVVAGAAGAPVTVHSGACRIFKIVIKAAGTAAVTIYDSLVASGTVLITLPASAVAGVYDLNVPCAVGITVGNGANTPNLGISWT